MSDSRYIIKRSGKQVPFESIKIRNAIEKANAEEKRIDEKLSDSDINDIVEIITGIVYTTNRALSVEEIQDLVEKEICKRAYSVFLLFHDYRYRHAERRKMQGIDAKIAGIINVKVNPDGSVSGENEEVKQENSNKNPTILSVQRDYMAGEWSRYWANKYVLPEDIKKAHEEGIIHFHDADYFAQAMHNCDLINLEDMLQNGTAISGTQIDKPKSFATACTVTSQIAAAVASSQYGGQTMTLAHLAPFVQVSRDKIYNRLKKELTDENINVTDEQLKHMTEKELLKEIQAGCQTIQYQLITLHSTNGQAPFITLFMYLDEVDESMRDDLALIIKTMLEQRMLGVKDASGNYVTPAFPKLIYALDEDNIHPDSKYYWLTELAAKCTAKRLVPDYISIKKMKEYKNGDTYPCMGCVDGQEVITYKYHNHIYTESFEKTWYRLSKYFDIKLQPNGKDFVMKTPGVKIYDQMKGFVANYGIIKNHTSDWLRLTFSNCRSITCTPDHPFETTDGRIVFAKDLTENDKIASNTSVDYNVSQSVRNKDTIHIKNVESFTKNDFSYDVTTESEHFTVSGIYSHNCRSFLTPDRFTNAGLGNIANAKNYDPHKHKYYGRFNMGVVTINLVDAACSSGRDMDKFWNILNERLELCHKALRLRYEHLLGTPSDVAPILWQDGGLARLKHGETIDKLLTDGYATISLGYAGLAECVYYMLGESHTEPHGKDFGIKVMQALNDACNKWKTDENIDYSVYGTPLESTTYKFAKCLQRRFGVIENVTDHNYITNSYHINVRQNINAFDKLTKEAEFQALSPGGAISYVEVPDMQDNIPAILAVIKHIYNTILYAELNTKSDLCEKCGYDGEIKVVKKNGKLIWRCPKCGNEDQNTMHVTRRTCGYIGTQYWNQGRTQEIADRVLHL